MHFFKKRYRLYKIQSNPFLEDMETGEVSRQARPQGFGEAAPITADQLASAIASAQTALGRPTPPSPGKIKVPMLTLIGMREGTFHPLVWIR